jgi:hypothetical protein
VLLLKEETGNKGIRIVLFVKSQSKYINKYKQVQSFNFEKVDREHICLIRCIYFFNQWKTLIVLHYSPICFYIPNTVVLNSVIICISSIKTRLKVKVTKVTQEYICYLKLWNGQHIKIKNRTLWQTDDFHIPIVIFIFINSYIPATSTYGVYMWWRLCPVQWFLTVDAKATPTRLRRPSIEVSLQ